MGGGKEEKRHPEERALAEIGKESWEEYKRTYVPIENQWMARVSGLDSDKEHYLARGMGMAEFRQSDADKFNNLQGSVGAGDASSRGNYIDDMVTTANNASQISNQTSLGVTDRYARGMESIVGIGQGKATEGLEGLKDVAERSVQSRIDNAKNRSDRESQYRQGLGALAGGGLRYGFKRYDNEGTS